MKKIFLSLVLIVAGNFMAFGQNNPVNIPKGYVPKDQQAYGYFEYQNNVALAYRYKIEFFRNVGSGEGQKIAQEGQRGQRPSSGIQPFKTITFQEVISVVKSFPKGPAILVCTDPTHKYETSDLAEAKVLGIRPVRDRILLRNPKGEFHDFCGVIGVDGTIVAQMPRPWNLPLYEPLGILSNGKEALFGVGHTGYMRGDTDNPNFICQYFIRWTSPNKIEKVEVTQDKFHAMVNKFGALECAPPYYESK